MSSAEDSDGFLPTANRKKSPAKSKSKKPARVTKKAKSSTGDPDDDDILSQSSKVESNAGLILTKSVEDTYQKKTQIEHILLRPDTYIGSVEATEQEMWIMEEDKLVKKNINFSPGLYKIFDEILVNAADNKIRDPSMKKIEVTIDKESNTISVLNDGKGIPIVKHKKENVYVPELIFGHLLTSSNYDDSEKKVVGGRNGYGAKLCNIFSTEFTVETVDSNEKKKYFQLFTNNMNNIGEPQITNYANKKEYTRITFKPDLSKFGITEIGDDMIALLKRRVFDMCGTVKNIKVYLNGEILAISSFQDYIKKYLSSTYSKDGSKPNFDNLIYEKVGERWEVGIFPNIEADQLRQVSFVNSISTSKGGTHVSHVTDKVVEEVINKIKDDSKKIIRSQHVAINMWVFINCLIDNPSFDSQTKESLTLKQNKFGTSFVMSEKFKKALTKSDIVDNVKRFLKAKEKLLIENANTATKSSKVNVKKLEDANYAGTSKSKLCTLILTEGDSAKGLAVAGLAVQSRDIFGVFPLRGKLLNVRDAATASILKNEELSNLCKILGLKMNKHYEDISSLRYGHVMIMTDQDTDGSHIKGLLINYIDHFYPSLLKVPGFLQSFITPIVKATKKSNVKQRTSFYTLQEYRNWQETVDTSRYRIKYYKGLATSTKEEGKEYFSDLQKHVKDFYPIREDERDLIKLAFSKQRADDRKRWLGEFQLGTFIDYSTEHIEYRDFINKELIQFSLADCVRSIPSVMDGFKQGQRKIMFGCFKKNLKEEIKVAQLVGYVSEHSSYHHGEVSLAGTIINMAQDFVGSNNINLLTPNGIFGSRAAGGKDAGSQRYIFTNLNQITKLIYHPDDSPLLNYLEDDGLKIEPEWYVPVLPMVLCNGAEGIGTGWSTNIPSYDPRDIVQNLMRKMDGEEFQDMVPWYRHFEGDIIMEEGKYISYGIISEVNETTIEISELPIQVWTNNYKNFLDSLRPVTTKAKSKEKTADNDKDKDKDKDNKAKKERKDFCIENYLEYHTDSKVNFKVTLNPANMEKVRKIGLTKAFKLTSNLLTSNIVCFNHQNQVQKYSSPIQILDEFYDIRLDFYTQRKQHLNKVLDHEISKLNHQVRFILQMINKELDISNKPDNVVLKVLEKEGYPRIDAKSSSTNDDDEEGGANLAGYTYLLGMPIRTLTMKKVEKLKNQLEEKESELKVLLSKTEKDLWKEDLNSVTEAFNKMLDLDEHNKIEDLKDRKKNQRGGPKKGKLKDDEDYVPNSSNKKNPPKPKKPKLSKPTNPKEEPQDTAQIKNEVKEKPIIINEPSSDDDDLIKRESFGNRVKARKNAAKKPATISNGGEKQSKSTDYMKSETESTAVDLVSGGESDDDAVSKTSEPEKLITLKGKKATSTVQKPKSVVKRIPKRIADSDDDDHDFITLDHDESDADDVEEVAEKAARPKRKRNPVSYTGFDNNDEVEEDDEFEDGNEINDEDDSFRD